VRGYKRNPPSLHLIHAEIPLFTPVSLPSPPLFFKQRPPWAARLTSLPSLCTGAKALPELRAAPRATGPPPSPPLSSGAIDRTGELRIAVACPPQCELVLLTASDGCTVAIDASHGHLPVDVSTVARLQSHRVTCVAPRRRAARALHVVWVATWAVHKLRYGPHQARPCPVTARLRIPHALYVWAGHAGFGLWTVF
jgi:hypothetical protein